MKTVFGPPSDSFLALATAGRGRLASLVASGDTPDPATLAGREYRGLNVRSAATCIGIRKFMKGFARGPGARHADAGYGYNVATLQNRLGEPWVSSTDRHFGFYRVLASEPRRHRNALVLDYAQGGNHRLDPTGLIRDYLVRAVPGSDDLLVGKAYLRLGVALIPVGYFLLEATGATLAG